MIRKYFRNKVPNVSSSEFNSLLEQTAAIRKTSGVIALYGTPTAGNWLGISNATQSVFGKSALPIPQHFSLCRLDRRQIEGFLEQLKQQKFERVVLSGFAPYFLDWIQRLHTYTCVEILYHGTISEWHDSSHREIISALIRMGKRRQIQRFGFVKKGLEEVFATLYGFDAFHQPLPDPVIPEQLQKLELDRSKIHIGVFGADTFNKNLHNQVVHALMIPNTVVHVLDSSIFDYLEYNDRIVGHGTHLPREVFLGILASMDLNLYMSFNESWGLVVKESETLGVLCLGNLNFNYLSEIKNIVKD
jgi:glycosyltransferase involved in cell wall biosynthesis